MGGHRRGVDARGVLREGARAREQLPQGRVSAHDGSVLSLFRFVIARVNQIIILLLGQSNGQSNGQVRFSTGVAMHL